MSLLKTIKERGQRLNLAFEPDETHGPTATSVLAIESAGSGAWRALAARIDDAGVTIHGAYEWPMDTADSMAVDPGAPPGLHDPETAVLFVPEARQSVCRLLDMPDAPQAQLEQMVALRLEVELPYPPHESTWACRRLPSDSDELGPVLLIAQASRAIADGEVGLDNGKHRPRAVVFAAAALTELVRDAASPVAVVKVDRDQAVLAVACGGALCYARNLRVDPEQAGGNGGSEQRRHRLARDLKQCLFDYTTRTGHTLPAALHVAGTGIAAEDCTALQTELDLPVMPVSLPEPVIIDAPEVTEAAVVANYPLAAGALLGLYREHLGQPAAAPALRPARTPGTFRINRALLRLLAINAVLLAVLIASVFLVQRGRLASAERFVRESKGVLTGMEALEEEVDILRYEDGQRVSVLEILMELGEALPKELKVETFNLDSKGTLRISGITKSVEAVSDGVTGALKQSRLFKNPQFQGATQEGKDTFGFTLTCEIANAGAGR